MQGNKICWVATIQEAIRCLGISVLVKIVALTRMFLDIALPLPHSSVMSNATIVEILGTRH